MKKPLDIMMEAMNMVEIPVNNKNGRRNLKYRLPEIVEHLLLESLGDGEPRDNWVEEGIRLLRPDHYDESPLNRKNMIRVYANMLEVYEFIRSNGLIETENMKKFKGDLIRYQRATEHLDAEDCKDSA